ncbi:MAG: hypothetical protein PHO66_05595, partial [Eubacteriales bacterium]|nr:hypothetical protein [Eubacteriales bacterium]
RLAGALAVLPKYFDGAHVTVYIWDNATMGESLNIEGFYGSGSLTVRNDVSGRRPTVNDIYIGYCSGIAINVLSMRAAKMQVVKSQNVYVQACVFNITGSGTNGILTNQSDLIIDTCEINAYHAIWAGANSNIYAYACTGDCTYALVVRDGSVIRVDTTRPYGSTSTAQGGEVRGSASEAHGSGYTPPPVPPTQTVQIALADSRSHRASPDNQWYAERLVGYGRWTPNGIWTGCMRFDLSALAGKTVLSARLRLLRRNGVGGSSAETITIQTYTSPATLPGGNTSGNAPVRSGAGASATIPRGVATWMDVNPADVQAILGGDAVGLCLYTGSTGYGKCDGLGDATPPILEVTYQ